jgi:hypothetical protein
MYYHWLEDESEKHELLKHHGILIGSFTNPSAAKKMLGDESTQMSSDDKDFEETLRQIREQDNTNEQNNTAYKKRRRKKLITNG